MPSPIRVWFADSLSMTEAAAALSNHPDQTRRMEVSRRRRIKTSTALVKPNGLGTYFSWLN